MRTIALPPRTEQQLLEFKRRSDILYNDYQYANSSSQEIADSEYVAALNTVFKLLRQISDSFKVSDEPGEDIPEITKLMSESFVPNILRFLERVEECWVSLQAAIGLNDEDEAYIALEVFCVKVGDSGLDKKIQRDVERLKQLGF